MKYNYPRIFTDVLIFLFFALGFIAALVGKHEAAITLWLCMLVLSYNQRISDMHDDIRVGSMQATEANNLAMIAEARYMVSNGKLSQEEYEHLYATLMESNTRSNLLAMKLSKKKHYKLAD